VAVAPHGIARVIAAPVSGAVAEALVRAMSVEDLRHLVGLLEARQHVPNERAREIAERLAVILTAEPLATELGPIENRPTVGFWRRWWPERLA